MTTEEKVRAYDELLVKAKQIYNKENDVLIIHTIEDLFPELKESEDERIREALIRFHKSTIDIDGIKGADIISWLEKQGKPSDEEMKTLLRTEYEKGRADAIAEMQKEWSEEDEAKRNALIGLVKEIKNQPLKRLEDWDGYISWLKSLRSQNNITEKELAQAKKNAYNDALDKIEYHSGEPTFDDGWSAAIDYIQKKSLRPQNRWKPSDEQIKFLQAMVNEPNNASSESCQIVLKDILEKLKKLKEG